MSIIINLLTGITKLRDAWPKINQNFTNIKTEVGALDVRVDTIITTPVEGVSAEEIVDARVGEGSLGAKIRSVDAQLADIATEKDYAGISNTIQKMVSGVAVKGVCYGDSLTYGYQWHDNGNPVPNIQVASTYPMVLQDLLIKTFKNNNIVIVNKGTSGQQTTQALAAIQANVLDLLPDFVIIMYGSNDAGTSLELNLYQSNLEEMIKKCLKNGIEVILVSPPTWNINSASDVKIMYYVEAMKEMATVYGISFVNLHNETMKMYANKSESPTSLLPDNLHFADTKYHYIADVVMDNVFEYGFAKYFIISDIAEIPIVNSPYIETDCTGVYTNSFPFFVNTNYFTTVTPSGTYLRFSFYVDRTGLNLVLKSIKTYNGGKIDVKVDGVVVKTIDFYALATHGFDVEDTIIENVSFGYHTVEFLASSLIMGQSADTQGFAYFTSFAFKKVKPNLDYNYNLAGVAQATIYEQFKRIIDGTLRIKHTTAGVLDGKILFSSDNLELKTDKTLVLEAYGNIVDRMAITWFGKKADNPSNTLATKINFGYMVMFDMGELDLLYANEVGGVVQIFQTTGLVLTYPSLHKIRIEHTFAGAISVYLDDVLKISVTDTKNQSGYSGVFLSQPGTAEITRFEYCYI